MTGARRGRCWDGGPQADTFAAEHGEQRVQNGIQQAFAAGLFAVPIFIYRDEMFWGNDHLDWLVRAIKQGRGQPVADVRRDLMARPQG